MPNTLIFVDLPSDDPAAAARFYAEVFGWQNDEKPAGVYHRMVPGGQFPNPMAPTARSATSIWAFSMRPMRAPIPTAPGSNPAPCQDGPQAAHLDPDQRRRQRRTHSGRRHAARGKGTVAQPLLVDLQRLQPRLQDPWGNEIVLWGKAGPEPKVPADFTRE
jgi:hypothetical protein